MVLPSSVVLLFLYRTFYDWASLSAEKVLKQCELERELITSAHVSDVTVLNGIGYKQSEAFKNCFLQHDEFLEHFLQKRV